MSHVVVIGGSVAGLGTSLALARAGHRVTVLERDSTPLPATPVQAFEKWERRGAPQVRHSHAFLARLRNALRDRTPDLLEALLEAGAEEIAFRDLLPPGIDDRSPPPDDADLVMLACRRLSFEWVLRRTALAEPGLSFRDGAEVVGLLADPGRIPRVCGVRLRAPGGPTQELNADLVVDAGGRRSRLPRWLEEIGARPPEQHSEPCGIFYCSRFYRLRPGAALPEGDTTIGADLGYLKYAVFHGDSRIFSITLAASPEDPPLRSLLRERGFEAAAAALPATRAWRDPSRSEPITDVHAMAGLRNALRCYLPDGEPVALGVLAVGDAALHTNPLYGRGCSLAWVHAELLAGACAAHGDDHPALAQGFEAATRRELLPWYKLSVAQDRDSIELARRERCPEPTPASADRAGVVDPKAYLRALLREGLVPALRSDARVARAFFRAFNLLDPPGDVLRDPEVLRRVLGVYARRGERQEQPLGPGRTEMLGILGRA